MILCQRHAIARHSATKASIAEQRNERPEFCSSVGAERVEFGRPALMNLCSALFGVEAIPSGDPLVTCGLVGNAIATTALSADPTVLLKSRPILKSSSFCEFVSVISSILAILFAQFLVMFGAVPLKICSDFVNMNLSVLTFLRSNTFGILRAIPSRRFPASFGILRVVSPLIFPTLLRMTRHPFTGCDDRARLAPCLATRELIGREVLSAPRASLCEGEKGRLNVHYHRHRPPKSVTGRGR